MGLCVCELNKINLKQTEKRKNIAVHKKRILIAICINVLNKQQQTKLK